MSSQTNLDEALHATGRRLTTQRALVLKIVEDSEEHLDAETIWRRATEMNAQLNLATVYRSLAVLKEMGLVQQRYFARDHKREVYESATKPEHFHFTCLSCGMIVEFETTRIQQAKFELSEEQGVSITHACICLEGYCKSCVSRKIMEN